jgi:hypothetical protein
MSDQNVPAPPDPRLEEIAAEREARPIATRPPELQTHNLRSQASLGLFGPIQTYLGVPRINVPIVASQEVQAFLDTKPELTKWDPEANKLMDKFEGPPGIVSFFGSAGQRLADLASGFSSSPSTPSSDGLDIAPDLMNKVVRMLPESLRYHEVLDEMWFLPLVAVIARADATTGVNINGVQFNGTEIESAVDLYAKQSVDVFAATANLVETSMSDEAGPDSEMINPQAIRDATFEIINNMMTNPEVEVQVRPDMDSSESAIEEAFKQTANIDSGVGVNADGDLVMAGGQSEFSTSVEDDGTLTVGLSPVMDDAGLAELLRSTSYGDRPSAAWDEVIEMNRTMTPDGRMEANTSVDIGVYGESNPEYDPRTNRPRTRRYTPASAVTALYGKSKTEIGNLQDKLIRSGYLNQSIVDRGSPTDEGTMNAWKSALADALKNNRTVDKQIVDRVRNTPLMPIADQMGEEWIQTNLGRDITFGEKQMMRRYVNDPNRRTTMDQDLTFGSQIDRYFKAQTRTERQASAASSVGNTALEFAMDPDGYGGT